MCGKILKRNNIQDQDSWSQMSLGKKMGDTLRYVFTPSGKWFGGRRVYELTETNLNQLNENRENHWRFKENFSSILAAAFALCPLDLALGIARGHFREIRNHYYVYPDMILLPFMVVHIVACAQCVWASINAAKGLRQAQENQHRGMP